MAERSGYVVFRTGVPGGAGRRRAGGCPAEAFGSCRMELFSVLGLADGPVLLAVISLLAALVLSLVALARQGGGGR